MSAVHGLRNHPSAQQNPAKRKPTLQPVTHSASGLMATSGQAKLRRLPFLLVVATVLGVGMVGLLILNVTLQNQSFELRQRKALAAELSYVQADLDRKVVEVSSSKGLATRATALGMQPNLTPVYLVLPDGKVLGQQKVVGSGAFPGALQKTPGQLAAERVEAQRKAAEKAAAEKKAAEEKAAAEKKAAEEKAAAEKKAAEEKAAAEKKAEEKKAADQRSGRGER